MVCRRVTTSLKSRKNIKFIVLSKNQAEQYWKEKKDFQYAVISINDPGVFPNLGEDAKRVDVLTLHFDDVGTAWDTEFFENAVYFTEKDAKKILAFAENVQKKCDTIIVHCKAGIARSCATACALESIFGSGFDHQKHGEPNTLIAQTIIKCWNKNNKTIQKTLPRAWRAFWFCKDHPKEKIYSMANVPDFAGYCYRCKKGTSGRGWLDLLSGEEQLNSSLCPS